MSGYPGTVYLLHFAEPIGNPARPNRAGLAQHYIGYAEPGRLLGRVAEQLAGGSAAAKIMQHCRRVGVSAELARVWEGDRAEERRIKRKGGASRVCPLCGIRPASPRPRSSSPERPPWWPEPGARRRVSAAVVAHAAVMLEALAAPPF